MLARLPERIAQRHGIEIPDLPGHGDAASEPTDLTAAADALAARFGPAVWVGYSMGGRHALAIATGNPEAVRGLVLVGATAGIEDHGERAARRQADEARAAGIERDGVDAFLERWLAQPLFAGVSVEAAGVEDRRRNTAAGLAASLRGAGTGAQDPLWDRLGEIGRGGIPVLVTVGEHDAKFLALGERLVGAIGPTARLAVIAGAGHAAHLEQPDRFVTELAAWLDEVAR